MVSFFVWRRRRDLVFDHLRFIVASLPPVAMLLESSLAFARFIAHRARSQRSLSCRTGAIVQIFRFIMPPNKNTTRMGGVLLAEKERFELSRRVLWQPTPLAGAPLRPLEYFSILWRVGLLV